MQIRWHRVLVATSSIACALVSFGCGSDGPGNGTALPDSPALGEGSERPGKNERPKVEITSPDDGQQLEAGSPVAFVAVVSDDRDPPGELIVTVRSSLQGELYSAAAGPAGGVSFESALSEAEGRLSW